MSGKCNACGSDLCPICGGCCVEGECGCYPVPDCKNCTELAAANDTIKALREEVKFWQIKTGHMASIANWMHYYVNEGKLSGDDLDQCHDYQEDILEMLAFDEQALKDGERPERN